MKINNTFLQPVIVRKIFRRRRGKVKDGMSESSSKTRGPEDLVQFVDGFPLSSLFFSPDVFRQVVSFEMKAGDVVLSTFPKCGTTWTQYIIWGLLNDGRPPPGVNQVMFKDFPFLELVGMEDFLALSDPRLAKVHLPYDLTPKGPGALLIHVMRNPFDACVSLWHHILEIDAAILEVDLPFDVFFETFMNGTCMFGDYFQHETSWFEHRNDTGVLFITYESMKKDPAAGITKIAEFLGMGEEIVKDDGRLLQAVLRHSDFNYMKDNCQFKISRDPEALASMGDKFVEMSIDPNTSKDEHLFRTPNFFRKGQVGKNRDQFSADQWRRLEQKIQDKVTNQELRELMKYPD